MWPDSLNVAGRSLSEKPLTMALGLVSSAYTGFCGSSPSGHSPSWTWREGRREELELPTGQETLTALRDGEGGGEGVGGVGGCCEEGRKWKLL